MEIKENHSLVWFKVENAMVYYPLSMGVNGLESPCLLFGEPVNHALSKS